MQLRTALLTLILISGFTLQCNICDCPSIDGSYFDIKGMELIHYKQVDACCQAPMTENEAATFSNYKALSLEYQVDYYGENCRHPHFPDFSLINSAMACSCAYNGVAGSKNEKITSLTVITLNDFDAQHLANDTINDLLSANVDGEIRDLTEFLSTDTSLIYSEAMYLKLKKAPELNEEFKVKVRLELSTSEVYEAESVPVKIRN